MPETESCRLDCRPRSIKKQSSFTVRPKFEDDIERDSPTSGVRKPLKHFPALSESKVSI